MNARQRRKLAKLKRGPWPTMWRGKAWHDLLEEWVTLWPDHPEIDELIRDAKSRHLVQAALRQGQVYARKQQWKRQVSGQGPDEAIRALLQNADFMGGYPPVVVKRIRNGLEVLE